MKNSTLENNILRSMVESPIEIEEFLKNLSPEMFSKEGFKLLEKIQELNNQGILNITSLETALSDEFKNSEWYIDFLNSEINPNYLQYKELFVFNYRLELQSSLANKLLKASMQGEILDVDTLRKSEITTEYKTLNDWEEYFTQQPPAQKFKSHVDFLDSCFDNGFEGGQLVLISGDPEAGKTMLGTQIIENMSKSHKVAFFCFEFTINSYLKARKYTKALSRENMILINDGYNINEIAFNIKELYKQGVRVFLIDSQMRIVSPNGRNMEEEESLKFSTLARLCHSLGIVVFLIVQTSKGDRDNPMGSKKGGHEASIILRLEHCKAQEELREFSEDQRMLIVKKNKQTGKHFKEKVLFKDLRFYSLQREVEPNAKRLDLSEVLEVTNIRF